jgi:hypothetical protein
MELPRERWFRQSDEYEPASLPPVVCLATYGAMESVRDIAADCSSLRVVWFQNEFGPPTDAGVLAQLKAIDWRTLATDGNW